MKWFFKKLQRLLHIGSGYESMVTQASPDRVIFNALQCGGSQEAKSNRRGVPSAAFLCKALAPKSGLSGRSGLLLVIPM